MNKLMAISNLLRKYSALIVLVGIFSATGYASAAGQLTISQTTGLTDGQVVSVSGSGLLKTTNPSNPVIGAILECNSDSSQPNVTVFGNSVPVSCSIPTNATEETDSNGSFGPVDFTVHTGTIGPPCTPGTTGCPSNAASEAAQYPCPPTAAEIAKGITCNIQFGDSANGGATQGDDVVVPISFASTSGGGSGQGTGGSGGQSTVSDTSGSGSSSTLVNTGPGQVAFVAAILAAVSGTALFLSYKLHKIRS